MTLRGLDLVVALSLTLEPQEAWTYARLGATAGVSASTAHASIERLRLASLVDLAGWNVFREALWEFLAHGARHAFAVRPGPEETGVPTASSYQRTRNLLHVQESPPFVWPHPGGSLRGASIEPLHASVPRIALEDDDLHERLALVDSARIGRARERAAATALLKERIAP